MHNYKSILFDCDGVLLDSNPIKSEAFEEVLSRFDAHAVTRFIAYHQANGGVSRYAKFRHFFTDIINQPYTEAQIQDLSEAFGKICQRKLKDAPLTEGAIAYLDSLPATLPKYIVSGGNQSELRAIFKYKGLDHYFNGILGSPDTKPEILEREMRLGHIQLPSLFIGDSQADYDAATQYGCEFVFMSGYTEWKEWQRHIGNIRTIQNLAELQR